MNDVDRLRATIFERTGISVAADDPLLAVLVASTYQTEEVGRLLLKRISPVRMALIAAAAAMMFTAVGASIAWEIASSRARAEQAEWLRQLDDPRTAALLRSDQGRAGLHLAELGVATLLARCSGRPSWRIAAGYCIPTTADGKPDGFSFSGSSNHLKSRGRQ